METRCRRMAASCLLLFLASALLLLFMSTCSPLYPLNPWPDANCYMTVGRGMRAGLLPYRDLVEQKGPLIYALHMIASYAAGGGRFFGVYLLEVAALTLFLIAALKTIELFCEDVRLAVPMLIALAAVMLSTDTFAYGDSAEEFCLPLMAWSLYDALRCIRGGGEPGGACLLRNGVLAGCILWTKYSILGLHFAWMAFFAIDCLARRRGFLRAVRMCLIFLAGMAVTALPWLIYFGVNGALGDLFEVYFVENLVSYPTKQMIAGRIFYGVLAAFEFNAPVMALVVLCGLWTLGSKQLDTRGRLCLLAMLAGTTVFTTISGRRFFYMFYIWAAYAPLCFVPLVQWFARLDARRFRIARAAAAGLALCVCGLSLAGGNMIANIGYPKDELAQVKFAEAMRKDGVEHPVLLNCGFLDSGFYLAADALPQERWFCKLNVRRGQCFEAQKRFIESGSADYVVTRVNELSDLGISDAGYELAMEVKDSYNLIERFGSYRLYRRKDLA